MPFGYFFDLGVRIFTFTRCLPAVFLVTFKIPVARSALSITVVTSSVWIRSRILSLVPRTTTLSDFPTPGLMSTCSGSASVDTSNAYRPSCDSERALTAMK